MSSRTACAGYTCSSSWLNDIAISPNLQKELSMDELVDKVITQ